MRQLSIIVAGGTCEVWEIKVPWPNFITQGVSPRRDVVFTSNIFLPFRSCGWPAARPPLSWRGRVRPWWPVTAWSPFIGRRSLVHTWPQANAAVCAKYSRCSREGHSVSRDTKGSACSRRFSAFPFLPLAKLDHGRQKAVFQACYLNYWGNRRLGLRPLQLQKYHSS
jgi:hypothetical protein